jgi:hypothetical protein
MDVPIWFDRFLQAGFYLRGWSPKTAVIYRRAFASFWLSASRPGADRREPAALSKATLQAWVIEMRQREGEAVGQFESWAGGSALRRTRIHAKRTRLLQNAQEIPTPSQIEKS